MRTPGADDAGRAIIEHQTYEIALIVDEPHREPIASVLDTRGFACSSFADVDEMLANSVVSMPSAILLWIDDASSGLSGEVESLTRSLPQTPVIVVCHEIERWGVRAALIAGASGVALLGDLELTLGPCIHAALAGQTCVPRQHSRQIEPPALSSREKQILGLVVMGYTNGQIARQLFLAESTVKSHLSSAFGKLGVRSRNAAVNLILDPERGLGMGILALGGEPVGVDTQSAM
jgi:DNA-binding NarL/FixJ family response regulator